MASENDGSAAAAAGRGDPPDKDKDTQAGRKPKFPCLRCRKGVTKNSRSVKCSTCDQWVHADCEQISAEMFSIIANPEKHGATGFLWNCQSCMAGAVRLEKLVRNLEGNLREVEDRVRGTECAVSEIDKRVGKLETAVRSSEGATEAVTAKVENTVLAEVE